ncbi:c-type cytochrome domain-containing protein [Frigoriglobus tundricola]|uniref:Cytochrome C Planctomycete-type domain-containing protein n=1 Tax=Frigoriglobus tundricola TaxID=2774151 RepID=A0A6M5YUU7_9BACT|nr:c-type cytochrome domain-containing protein [Frigoriglobus tundricola]QJW97214.1 hypothetical protein FTUN_4781 [Frigoriglobus tundricola]
MASPERPSTAIKLIVAALFLSGLAFGAFVAPTEPEPKAPQKPVAVAKAEPSKPVATVPEPEPEPKPKPKTEPKPQPKLDPKPEPKKPDPKSEPEPKSDPKPQPKPEPKAAVTFQKAQAVLQYHCVSCHGSPVVRANIDMRTLDSIKKKKGLVVPGDPAASDMWNAILAETMPPPDAKTKMTEAEKTLIKEWIAGGAK